MRRFRKKLTPQHQAFVNKYVQSRYNPLGLYKKVYFCEDENIAFVLRVEDYRDYNEYIDDDIDEVLPNTWGCVNMAHQLLMPFEYERIYDFGHFLIGKGCDGYDLFNKKGQKLYEIGGVRRTPHMAYKLILNEDWDLFRISIRKISISKGLYSRFYVLDNGLAFVQKENGKVGLILFTKLKLPFEYYSIAIPQNGYTLGVIESCKENGTVLYDCQLIKVRSQIKKEDSIHPTGIYLFTRKTIDEVNAYFADKNQVEADCNTIVCYNQNVCFCGEDLKFFPYDTSNVGEEEEEYDEVNIRGDYNEWEHYTNGSRYEKYNGYNGYDDDTIDIAFEGDPEATWNVD